MQTQILGLVTPLMALVFAATFAILWRAGRLKRHVLGFAIGNLLFACGFLITHLLPTDAVYLFHATHAFYSLGTVVLLASICERVGQRLHIESMAVVYVLTAAALALAVGLSDDAGPRLILVNMGYGVMFAMGAATLLAGRRREIFDIAIIVMVGLQAADFLMRPTLTLMFERTIPAGEYRESIYYSLIGLVLAVKAVASTMVLFGATISEWMAMLRESSQRDALTGLNNRAAFEQEMQEMLSRAHSEGRSVSLVVADIDHFKQVNDIWGHQAGDQAISGFGRLIQETVRGCDIAGRVGGEEFCIAVWNCPNEPAVRLAERIRVALARLEHGEIGGDIRLTASLGVATAREGESYERLFSRADEALYRAKNGGRNRVDNADCTRAKRTAEDAIHEPVELLRTAAK